MNELSRRQALRRGGVSVGALLAGCVGGDGATTDPGDDSGSTVTMDPTSTSERSTPTPGPGGTDHNETETETKTPLQDGVDWRFDTNAAIEVAPAVVGGTVYVGGWRETYGTPTPGSGDTAPDPSNMLRALSLEDGSEQWRTGLGAPLQRAPRVVDDTVYAVRGYNGLHGKDYQVRAIATNGRERWHHEIRRLKFLIVLGADDSGIYVGAHDDALEGSNEQVTALAPDGTVRWQAELGDINNGALDDDTVYATDYTGNVRAFEKDSGTVRWTVEWQERNLREPVVIDDMVVTAAETVVAFDRTGGTVQWESRERNPTGLVAMKNRIFVPTTDGAVVALNPDDGSEAWSIDTASERPAIALGDTTVYIVNGNGRLSAHDPATGDSHWEVDLGGRAGAVPAGDRVYAINRDRVVAVDANDGTRLGSVDVAGDPAGLVPADDTAVFATSEGAVYGLSL